MTTEAGKRLLRAMHSEGLFEDELLKEAIAEAVAAERARIVEGVRALTQYAFSLYDDGTDDRITVSLTTVLAIIEDDDRFEWYASAGEMAAAILAALREGRTP